jgi:hypothetical protein
VRAAQHHKRLMKSFGIRQSTQARSPPRADHCEILITRHSSSHAQWAHSRCSRTPCAGSVSISGNTVGLLYCIRTWVHGTRFPSAAQFSSHLYFTHWCYDNIHKHCIVNSYFLAQASIRQRPLPDNVNRPIFNGRRPQTRQISATKPLLAGGVRQPCSTHQCYSRCCNISLRRGVPGNRCVDRLSYPSEAVTFTSDPLDIILLFSETRRHANHRIVVTIVISHKNISLVRKKKKDTDHEGS